MRVEFEIVDFGKDRVGTPWVDVDVIVKYGSRATRTSFTVPLGAMVGVTIDGEWTVDGLDASGNALKPQTTP